MQISVPDTPFKIDLGPWRNWSGHQSPKILEYVGGMTSSLTRGRPAWISYVYNNMNDCEFRFLTKEEIEIYVKQNITAQCYQLHDEVHNWTIENNIDYLVSIDETRKWNISIHFFSETDALLFKLKWL